MPGLAVFHTHPPPVKQKKLRGATRALGTTALEQGRPLALLIKEEISIRIERSNTVIRDRTGLPAIF